MKRCSILIILWLALVVALPAQTNLEIKGMGWLQNRSLKSRLAFLQNLEVDQPAKLDAALIEDSAYLLIEQMKRDGFLQPTVAAEMVIDSKRTRRVKWEQPYEIQLNADATADAVTFSLEPGFLAFYKSVEVRGVSAIDRKELQRYFIPGGVLFQTRRSKVFTPENLDRRVDRVLQGLEAMGFRDAQLVGQEVEIDKSTGAVAVRLQFDEGARHYVGNVTLLTRKEGTEQMKEIEVESDTFLNREWEQLRRNGFRNQAFAAGYPDAEVTLERELNREQSDNDSRIIDVRFTADWGDPVTLGKVRFKEDEAVRRATLRRRLDLETGDPLNRLEVDRARRRLMGLGIYKNVVGDFYPVAGPERDVVYTLEPSVRRKLQILGGWGSYEQVRLGFKWEHHNPFGRAHRYELDVKQSLKSTFGELSYFIPQVFDTDVLVYTNFQYNYREEITYDRTKQGASFGASYTTATGLRLAVEYGFFQEEADRDDESSFESEENATVASVSFTVSYDRRDDFLAPRSGYNIYGEFKVANRWLGGNVDFQKLEVGGSYHFPLTQSTLVHLGLRGGIIIASGETSRDIPFNERFFPGGENSVRGYREGQASPLDSKGDQIGAESYGVLNLELEQRLYPKFSTLVFFDSVVTARDGFDGASNVLHSCGLGLRYQTVVGPVRLEYGHNLNPRADDPDGTLHFSIGFPF